MAELKTTKSRASVNAFLQSVKSERRREDALTVLEMMKSITKQMPKMWGPSIVGFGEYHYKYESGREGDMPRAAFSPRREALTIYLWPGPDAYPDLMKTLGKHSTGKSCLYIKSLEDIHVPTLRKLITASLKKAN